MTTRISTPALSALAPYLVVVPLALLPGTQGPTRSSLPEQVLYVQATPVYRAADGVQLETSLKLDLGRPDLIPNVIVSPAPSYPDFYEPFIVSEGWREEHSLAGPFLVEEAAPPVVEFDDYERTIIDLFE